MAKATKEKDKKENQPDGRKHVNLDPDTHYRLDCIKSLKKCGTLANAVTLLVNEYISEYPDIGKFIEGELSKKEGVKK